MNKDLPSNLRIGLNRSLVYGLLAVDTEITKLAIESGKFIETNDHLPIEGLSMSDLLNNGKNAEAMVITIAAATAFLLITHLLFKHEENIEGNVLKWVNRGFLLLNIYNAANIIILS